METKTIAFMGDSEDGSEAYNYNANLGIGKALFVITAYRIMIEKENSISPYWDLLLMEFTIQSRLQYNTYLQQHWLISANQVNALIHFRGLSQLTQRMMTLITQPAPSICGCIPL